MLPPVKAGKIASVVIDAKKPLTADQIETARTARFDRLAYQREYMRRRRAEEKAARLSSLAPGAPQ